jgi:hypothetical protein
MSDGCIRFFMDDYPTMSQLETTTNLVDQYQPPTKSLGSDPDVRISWEETIKIVMTSLGR